LAVQIKKEDKMSDTKKRNGQRSSNGSTQDRQMQELESSPMMAHLLKALAEGVDIGHYGRLTFIMVARHFLDEEELVHLLAGQPDLDEQGARARVLQVKARDYSPPKRDRILEWQALQDFPICPDPDDPNGCNVYGELRFPEEVYERIGEFWEDKAEAES
jgi:hypothetical protein